MGDPVVYARVVDLPLIDDLPLRETDLLEVSRYNSSAQAPAGGLFGSGWFSRLMAAFSAFVAPEADHAFQADEAAYAEDAASVSGLDLATPSPPTLGSRELAAGEVWTPPAGSYLFFWNSGEIGEGATATDLQIEAKDASTFFLGRAPLGGLVVTDGASVRIRNTAAAARWLLWHKLA